MGSVVCGPLRPWGSGSKTAMTGDGAGAGCGRRPRRRAEEVQEGNGKDGGDPHTPRVSACQTPCQPSTGCAGRAEIGCARRSDRTDRPNPADSWLAMSPKGVPTAPYGTDRTSDRSPTVGVPARVPGGVLVGVPGVVPGVPDPVPVTVPGGVPESVMVRVPGDAGNSCRRGH